MRQHLLLFTLAGITILVISQTMRTRTAAGSAGGQHHPCTTRASALAASSMCTSSASWTGWGTLGTPTVRWVLQQWDNSGIRAPLNSAIVQNGQLCGPHLASALQSLKRCLGMYL
jgi:hypothetical protein